MANGKMALGQRKANEYEKKLVGIVTVKTGERKAKFTLTEDGKQFKNGTTSFTVDLDDLPKFPRLQTNDNSGKQYRIRMNSEGTEVEALTPVVGVFEADLIDLGPRPEKDADPMPREKVFDEGGPKENRHWEFFAVYKITGGAFKGVQMPAYNLHYKFEADLENCINPEDEEDDRKYWTRFAGNFENKKATRLFQLRDWGNLHKLWEEPIEWDDETILPELLNRGLENPSVRIIVKNGYISEVLPSEETPDFVAQGDDEDIDGDAAAVDEMLDGVVEEMKAAPKIAPKTGKVKPAPAKRVAKKSSDEDDDL